MRRIAEENSQSGSRTGPGRRLEGQYETLPCMTIETCRDIVCLNRENTTTVFSTSLRCDYAASIVPRYHPLSFTMHPSHCDAQILRHPGECLIVTKKSWKLHKTRDTVALRICEFAARSTPFAKVQAYKCLRSCLLPLFNFQLWTFGRETVHRVPQQSHCFSKT